MPCLSLLLEIILYFTFTDIFIHVSIHTHFLIMFSLF